MGMGYICGQMTENMRDNLYLESNMGKGLLGLEGKKLWEFGIMENV